MRPLFLLLPLLVLPNRDSYGAAGPSYEIASIKPNTSNPTFVYLNGPPAVHTFTATNATVQALIIYAYQVNAFQLDGGPAWLRSDRFDISTKPPEGAFTRDQYLIMLQALLEDRFKLAVHRTTKEVPVYALVPAKGGLKIKPASEACAQTGSGRPPAPDSPPLCGNIRMGTNSFEGRSVSMTMLLRGLANALGRPVVDQTGFAGAFDLHLEFAPPMASPDNPSPTIFTALREQLGLKLESQKGPADFLVIDHAEKPSEN
jgi:uncharacterized protein (TIGR03435 family)